MQGMSTHHIPAWVKPGTDVHAWLPPRGNGIYGPSRWYVTILSVREGGRARSDVATATVSWPGAHNNKQYIDWYPDLYEEHDAREENITMSLFFTKEHCKSWNWLQHLQRPCQHLPTLNPIINQTLKTKMLILGLTLDLTQTGIGGDVELNVSDQR